MGNSANANSLKEVANNTREPNEDEKDVNNNESVNNTSKQTIIDKVIPIDLATATFAEKIQFGLHDIQRRDKLSVIGYFREVAMNEYNIHIPKEIINYCIIFLFLEDESQLYIGNLHKLISTSSRNSHQWTMFISTSRYQLTPPKTIKEVVYYLHPTFSMSECTQNKSPFYLQRKGWGTFQVEAKIVFKDKYKRKDCYASHGLNFDDYARITDIDLEQKTRIKDDMNLWYGRDERETYEFKTDEDYPFKS
eukprot:80032_1